MDNNALSSDAGQFLQRQTDLLAAIRQAQSLFILRHDPQQVFAELLRILVTATGSDHGFLDEVLHDPDGTPYKLNLALSDISWDEDSRRLYQQLTARNLEFRNLNNLAGAPVLECQVVIANDAPRDPRYQGLPAGHPPLLSYLGIPLFFEGELIGVAGVANRPGGYDFDLVTFLEPLTATCAHLIWSVRAQQKEQQLIETLRHAEERFRLALQDSAITVFSHDRNLRYAWISNPNLAGGPISGILGKTDAELLPAAEAAQLMAIKRRVLDSGCREQGEIQLSLPTGARCFSYHFEPLTDQSSQIIGLTGTAVDITNQKQLEQTLRQYQFMVMAMTDSVSLLDRNYIYQIVNPGYLRLNGKEREAIIGHSVADLLGQETFEGLIKQRLDQALAGTTVHYQEWFNYAKAGRLFMDVTYSPYRDQQDNITGIVVDTRNITAIKQTQEELRTAKEFSESLINAMQDGLFVVDWQGVHLDVNPAFCQMTGFTKAELIGPESSDPYWPMQKHSSIVRAFESIINQNRNQSCPGSAELIFSRKNGEQFPVILTAAAVRDSAGKIMLYVATVKDISERKQAERLILDSKNELQTIYDSVPVMICQLSPDRKVIEGNAYFRSFTGWPDHPIALSEKACGILGCINALDDPRGCGFGPNCKKCPLRLAIADTLATGCNHSDIEYQTTLLINGVRKNVALLCSTALIQKRNKNIVLLSMIDITARRQAEEIQRIAIAKYQTLFDTFPLGITVSDQTGQIIEANFVSEELLGISLTEHCQRQINGSEWQIVRPDGTPMPAGEYASVRALKEQRVVDNVEMGLVKPSGAISWLNVTAAPLPLENYGVVITYSDITGRKQMERMLQHSLQEKETLLREVHHRVKNNLAAIISLIELEKDRVKDQSTRVLLNEMTGRIQSMSLVHEMLYQSSSLSKIDFNAYLQTLARRLHSAINLEGTIRIQAAAPGVYMNLDTAIPCGLIVNELVINAFKYAFPAGWSRSGADRQITISTIMENSESYVLSVADNGVGLPFDQDWATTRSLGLRLVRMLGQHQLQGRIELDRTGGTRFSFHFHAA